MAAKYGSDNTFLQLLLFSGYKKPLSSPFHRPIQEVEEGLQHHVVACLVWVMKLGRIQGNGGP